MIGMADTSTLCQQMADERAESLLAIVFVFASGVPAANLPGMKPSKTILGLLRQEVTKLAPTNCHRRFVELALDRA